MERNGEEIMQTNFGHNIMRQAAEAEKIVKNGEAMLNMLTAIGQPPETAPEERKQWQEAKQTAIKELNKSRQERNIEMTKPEFPNIQLEYTDWNYREVMQHCEDNNSPLNYRPQITNGIIIDRRPSQEAQGIQEETPEMIGQPAIPRTYINTGRTPIKAEKRKPERGPYKKIIIGSKIERTTGNVLEQENELLTPINKTNTINYIEALTLLIPGGGQFDPGFFRNSFMQKQAFEKDPGRH